MSLAACNATGGFAYRFDGFHGPVNGYAASQVCTATVQRDASGNWTLSRFYFNSLNDDDNQMVAADLTLDSGPVVTLAPEDDAPTTRISATECTRFDVRGSIDAQRKVHALIDLDCHPTSSGHVRGRASSEDCSVSTQ
ncbi:MAG: hypothetical protein JST54_33910 [Deltaproteobacteria bacterium]|nr:hypothetical protein [Deltaproteobacteria bacterium]